MSATVMPPLNGQWVGQSRGEPSGTVVLDLDAIGEKAVGYAYLFPHDNGVLATCLEIERDNKLVDMEIDGTPLFFNSANGYVPTLEEMSTGFPDTEFPNAASAKIRRVNANCLEIRWENPVGTFGKATVIRSGVSTKSSLVAESEVTNWKEFQEYVTDKLDRAMIFRGQSFSWPLRTSFHRTARKNLNRYLKEDIPRLHRALTGRTSHIFDLMNPQENGAFLNLAQHHGFPTPLLDWTRSPFVAAYFAFSSVEDTSIDAPVRVYAFDFERYSREQFQSQNLTLIRPHISVLEALSIENDRAVPQQGLLTLTNMHDIEDFMEFIERGADERYLFALDLPRSETQKALSDLRLMGITQATMFPGIESICRDLRSLHF